MSDAVVGEEKIEIAARAIASVRGLDPDRELCYGGGKPAWEYFVDDAAAAISAFLRPATGKPH